MTGVVRHNLDTHRVISSCECGATISLPDSGESYEFCDCGRGWRCDGINLAMYVPRDWLGPGERGSTRG
jgi:hypothetical protein